MKCAGPLIWFDVPAGGAWPSSAAIAQCEACGEVFVVTGADSMPDQEHAATPVVYAQD